RIHNEQPQARSALLELTQWLAEDAMRTANAGQTNMVALLIRSESASQLDLASFAGVLLLRPSDGNLKDPKVVDKYLTLAKTTASDLSSSTVAKRSALQILAFFGASESSPTILKFLLSSKPQPLQLAAASALAEYGQPPLFAAALKSWNQYQVSTRRQL